MPKIAGHWWHKSAVNGAYSRALASIAGYGMYTGTRKVKAIRRGGVESVSPKKGRPKKARRKS